MDNRELNLFIVNTACPETRKNLHKFCNKYLKLVCTIIKLAENPRTKKTKEKIRRLRQTARLIDSVLEAYRSGVLDTLCNRSIAVSRVRK
jgi:hypothetical protein